MRTKIHCMVTLVLLVCAGAMFARQTQNTVLVKGDPPLTQQMVDQLDDFFKWVLDISLTPDQLEMVKNATVKTWSTQNKEEIDSTLTILKTRADLIKAKPADRDHMRELIQPEVLKSLRVEHQDETARMLVTAYESAHRPNTNVVSQQPAGRAAVVGKWHTGSVSSMDFYNPTTGHWAAPSGTGMSYEISADGHYVYSGLLQTSMYQCTMSVFTYETGTWSVQGSMIVFSPTSGRIKSEDNCNRSFNYDKPKTLTKRSPAFSFKPTEHTGQEQLCLVESSGEICFRRETSAK